MTDYISPTDVDLSVRKGLVSIYIEYANFKSLKLPSETNTPAVLLLSSIQLLEPLSTMPNNLANVVIREISDINWVIVMPRILKSTHLINQDLRS